MAAKAICFLEAMTPEFVEYQKQVVLNAQALAGALAAAGYRIVSGGTDSHVFLLDVFSKGLRGKEAEKALDEAWITVNKNAIPFDRRGPFVTSGIRIGTPIVTTRGMGLPEMAEIGAAIARVLERCGDAGVEDEVRASVQALCRRFPFYRSLLRSH
jgi:glycine hydroxymethyltransferase